MGNEQSATMNWRQPAMQDIMKYAGAVKDKLYGNCPQTMQPNKLASQLSKKAMNKMQKRILAEYPYLCTVQESMVVCDNTQPDCPIVYVNDEFEKLTLYPKEEILGRNCRFLQGRYTNKDTVKKIRHAVENGLPLDIELFNYRKDGTGFFNNFLMLPVHKSKNSKVVTHFIAIQKDISMVKKDTNAQQWTPPECAIWFDYLRMGKYSDLLISNEIDGKTLLSLNEDDMENLGITNPKDREVLLRYLVELGKAPEAAYKLLEKKSENDVSESYTGAVEEVCLDSPQNQNIWRRDGQKDKKVAVKCYYKDEIVIFRGEGVKYSQINKLLETTWHVPMKMIYISEEENKLVIKNAADWKKAVKQSMGHVRVLLKKRYKEIPESVAKAYDALSTAVMLVDWEGIVLLANKAVKQIIGKDRDDLLHLRYTDIFPELKLSCSDDWTEIEAVGKKKKIVTVLQNVAMYDEMTYLIQAVPIPQRG